MIHTRFTELVGVRHPIVLGGMSGGTSPALVAAVSNAGGLGIYGASQRVRPGTPLGADEIRSLGDQIRSLTTSPFGLNLLLFDAAVEDVDTLLACRPRILSTAWRRPDQDLRSVAERAHASGVLFMHQADTLDEAKRAAEAGADIVVAQGTEGGGHVGLMASLPLARMVVRALPSIPVLVAGGIADGAGIAAALILGADGALLGTRFLATSESPLPDGYKRAIVESDGHDTVLSELPDIASGRVWPGAYARARRNAFIDAWVGREGELRRRRREVQAQLGVAREAGDAAHGSLLIGQDAGLIDAIEPAGALVARLVAEAEDVLRRRGAEVLA
ncbi:MAG: nitronate monooxygenase [Chloroflexota bacterium]|nr:nitronate monooxygenase [Chloroflexota bacterium]